MLCLLLEAPFAACRTFTAGWYRPTATFLTPSAAYGLLLNVAGVESRLREEDELHDGKVPATRMRDDLPNVRIALGTPARSDATPSLPAVQSVYQQLHNYPVGKEAGISAELAKGNKNNISPVRREFLSDLNAVILLEAGSEFEDRVGKGLKGELNEGRYGLPFVGDNQFLLDRLNIVDRAPDSWWYERIDQSLGNGLRRNTTRLTVWIDRADMSKTVSHLYAPSANPGSIPPEDAWTDVGPGDRAHRESKG